jgi:hypothetical protein
MKMVIVSGKASAVLIREQALSDHDIVAVEPSPALRVGLFDHAAIEDELRRCGLEARTSDYVLVARRRLSC